jgi:hypothetical protein
MLVEILETLGFFAGQRKSKYQEAFFFHKINDWIFQQIGATWDRPEYFEAIYREKEVRNLLIRVMENTIESYALVEYLGLRKFLRYKSLYNIDIPWGWKDPRNTFTLPFWLELFPTSKVIFIYRHGVDVAQSLKKRHYDLAKVKIDKMGYKPFSWLRWRRNLNWLISLRCTNLDGGFSLWEEYNNKAREYLEMLKERFLEIRYEDVLENPKEKISELANFCQLPVTDETKTKIIKTLNRNRGYAFLANQELKQFAKREESVLADFGYKNF